MTSFITGDYEIKSLGIEFLEAVSGHLYLARIGGTRFGSGAAEEQEPKRGLNLHTFLTPVVVHQARGRNPGTNAFISLP